MLFLLGVTACGIRQTQSRGGLISLAVAVCAVGLLAAGRLRPSARQAARGLVLAAAAGFGFYLHLHPELIGRVFSAPDNSTAERLSMYRSGLRMLGDFPVWGVGLGSAQSVFPAYQEAAVPGLVEHLHCDWLELAVTAGIVGAACYVAAFLLFLGRMRKLWLSAPSREMTALAFGALAAILAFAVHGLVDFSFQIPANAVVFLALAALLEASLRLARVPEYEAPRPRTPFLAQGGRE